MTQKDICVAVEPKTVGAKHALGAAVEIGGARLATQIAWLVGGIVFATLFARVVVIKSWHVVLGMILAANKPLLLVNLLGTGLANVDG